MQVVNDDSMQEGDSSLTFEELAAERLLSTRRRKKASLQELPPASEVSFPFKVEPEREDGGECTGLLAGASLPNARLNNLL